MKKLGKKTIKLSYRSVKRFSQDYALIKKGKIFLPSQTFLPPKTTLTLNIAAPGVDTLFTVKGTVIKALDEQTAAKFNRPAGMVLAIVGGPGSILEKLNSKLAAYEEYRDLLGLTKPAQKPQSIPAKKIGKKQVPPQPVKAPSESTTTRTAGGLDFTAIGGKKQGREGPQSLRGGTLKPGAKHPVWKTQTDADSDPVAEDSDDLTKTVAGQAGDAELTLAWLRNAVAQEQVAKKDAAIPEITVAPTSEKKDLTAQDREKIKPSGEFLIDLTKAMLRTGYYSADHPGSKNAKKGLYEAFQNCLGDCREIMITKQETREKYDILITGILDEPVNVRTLVGAGMADLFVPKLREYFNRKGLVSFAIKKNISLEHFENFVDIMGDPKADHGEKSKIGKLLSDALAVHGITEISTVFVDDLIMLELNLPWRVEMAIQRLTKDLKMLPMFRSESNDIIRDLKLQIIQDIMRPLRHPQFLKDLIIHCYIIAQHVENIKTEDIEQVIIEAFPLNTLLPTSKFICEELNDLSERHAEDQDNPILVRRVEAVKRILKWVVRRLVLEDIRGAQSFLEQLYLNEVLSFEELPPDVQYLVNTIKMVKDVESHAPAYGHRILHAESASDAVVLLKLCRRIMPTLFENNDWKIALLFTKAVEKAGRENKAFAKENGFAPNPQQLVFKNLINDLAAAFEKADDTARKTIDKITDKLGSQGTEIYSKVLADSENRQTRKAATDALIQKGETARRWVLKVLDNPKHPWYFLRNALMILRFVGKGQPGIDRARKFMSHIHPRVRDEALNTLLGLNAADAEQLVISALDDPDDKVLWRATNALVELSPLSETSTAQIVELIRAEIPEEEEEEEAAKHSRKMTNIIRALGTNVGIHDTRAIEEAILEIALTIDRQKKGIFRLRKKSSSPYQSSILSAAIATLGKIGSPKSETFLKKMKAENSSQAEAARKAAESIRQRYAKQTAGTPVSA